MTHPVVAGAEAFQLGSGKRGVLLLHGFTGNPSSMRPLGEGLADRGYRVLCPRYPDHGTDWRDLRATSYRAWIATAARALDELGQTCDAVGIAGLSVGGAMGLHLAARTGRPDALVVINPYILDRRIATAWLGRWVIPSVKGIGDDIRKEGQTELPYERIPLSALAQLARFIALVRRELPEVTVPLLVFRSAVDHVVPKGNVELLLKRVGSSSPEVVELPDSYHVATLDHDARTILDRTDAFFSKLLAVR
ncbi:MAG TPA: alpha/beta fold hydrolase [Actinomycetota bacterium]|nr:alpha/beta fold hydrolase [Actinomycetota bacterium]